MAELSLNAFHDPALSEEDLLARLTWLRDIITPRLERFLGYYRNPTTELAAAFPCPPAATFTMRPFRQFQELGLPARITGFRRCADGGGTPIGTLDVQRKEVVIENDIAWRINTLVDFAANRMPSITSTARDPATRQRLTTLINTLLQFGEETGCSIGGGVALLQELVLQGAICGSAWIQLRPSAELLARLAKVAHVSPAPAADGSGRGPASPDPDNASTPSPADRAVDPARWLALEVVESARLCPLPGAGDNCRDEAPAYMALLSQSAALAGLPRAGSGIFDRVRSWFLRPAYAPSPDEFSFDLFGPGHWQRYLHGILADEGENLLGVVPFVRFENAPDPAAGSRVGPLGSAAIDVGLGDVESLIGLQDELNTRLSDRASRVTMSCFRMFLGRGIEDFTKRPIGPGQMWATDNPQAGIDSFGGDTSMPSEESHIAEVREALDKISGVPPVAAGLLSGKLGNLTSAVALRITLIALLSRTERKRAALTQTLSIVVRLALQILDRAKIVATDPADRGIDVNWPTALPESDMDRLQEAQVKLALGVPRPVILTELGYGELEMPSSIPKPAPSDVSGGAC